MNGPISIFNALTILTAVASPAPAEEAPSRKLTPVPIPQVVIDDVFWAPRLDVYRRVTIPDCFAKFEKDGV